jgi:hypothetical protein
MEQVSAEGSSSATFKAFEAFGKNIVVQALAKVQSQKRETSTHLPLCAMSLCLSLPISLLSALPSSPSVSLAFSPCPNPLTLYSLTLYSLFPVPLSCPPLLPTLLACCPTHTHTSPMPYLPSITSHTISPYQVGWESMAGESHTFKLMRASVMGEYVAQ